MSVASNANESAFVSLLLLIFVLKCLLFTQLHKKSAVNQINPNNSK